MFAWYCKSDIIADIDSPTSFSHSSYSSLFVTLKSVLIFQLGRLILVDSMVSPGCHVYLPNISVFLLTPVGTHPNIFSLLCAVLILRAGGDYRMVQAGKIVREPHSQRGLVALGLQNCQITSKCSAGRW